MQSHSMQVNFKYFIFCLFVEIRRCKFSNDGLLFATCSADKTLKIWNSSTFDCVATLQGHTGYVTDFVFTYDNKHIISVSHDESIRMWSLESWQCVKVVEKAHFGDVNCRFCFE